MSAPTPAEAAAALPKLSDAQCARVASLLVAARPPEAVAS